VAPSQPPTTAMVIEPHNTVLHFIKFLSISVSLSAWIFAHDDCSFHAFRSLPSTSLVEDAGIHSGPLSNAIDGRDLRNSRRESGESGHPNAPATPSTTRSGTASHTNAAAGRLEVCKKGSVVILNLQ